jgi:hypothetical protein
MTRRQLATRLGVSGAVLGVLAGLVQAVAGYAVPEWTGDKVAYGALGLLTLGLSALAGVAALHQRGPGLSPLSRAACSLGLIGPGLLCLTTVGRLWYLPAVLLVTAGLLTIESLRATISAVSDVWGRVLVMALGFCELLAVAAGPGPVLLVGGMGGAALTGAAWWRAAPRAVTLSLILVGTVPLVAAVWAT